MAEVAVLTTTFYKSTDELRFRLACSTIEKTRAAGHDVIVVDGSPDLIVIPKLSELGAIVYPQKAQGMGPSRRELLSIPLMTEKLVAVGRYHYEGLRSDFYLWTEPEKEGLIRHIPAIIAPLRNGKTHIVLPKRKSLESYPAFQAQTETAADQVYMECTGMDCGPMFGPVAFVADMLPYFAKCNPKERYGPEAHDTYIQHIAPMEAMAAGYKVAVVEIDFIYPPKQKAEEEGALTDAMRAKRLDQLKTCTDTFRIVAKALGLPKK